MFFTQLSTNLPSDHKRIWLQPGARGTAETISWMQRMASHGKRDIRIRKLVGELIRGCPKKDYRCYAKAIYEFCRDRIQYAYDPVNVEYVEAPYRILETGIADCDSICALLASMLENIGLPSRYVTIKADPSHPDEYSHVFMEVGLPSPGGQRVWVGMDPTMINKPFGWQPPKHFPRKTWPASKDPSPSEGDSELMGLSELTKNLVPGVVNFDANVAYPSGDYRQTEYKDGQPSGSGIGTNLDGLGCCGGAKAHTGCGCGSCKHKRAWLSGFIGLGANEDQPATDIEASIYNIATGRTYEQLVALNKKIIENTKRLAAQRTAIEGMPRTDMQAKAVAAWNQAQATHAQASAQLVEAGDNYNKIARIVEAVTFRSITPKRFVLERTTLSGMGAFAIPYAVIELAVGAGVVLSLVLLINQIGAATGKTTSLLDQVAGIVKAGGGALRETAGLVDSLKWAALVGAGLYLGYGIVKDRRPSSGSALALKRVSGRVI